MDEKRLRKYAGLTEAAQKFIGGRDVGFIPDLIMQNVVDGLAKGLERDLKKEMKANSAKTRITFTSEKVRISVDLKGVGDSDQGFQKNYVLKITGVK